MNKKSLQQEIKKQQPFAALTEEAALNLLKTADLLQNRFGRLFREFGLTSSQYNVLRILRGAGEPLPSLEIAERLIQVVPAITGLIDRLEQQQFVERKRSAEDRRVVYVAITKKAEKLLSQIDQPLQQLHQELLGHMKQKDLQQLSALLVQVRHPS